jgi:hypothetical protein
MSTHKAKQRKMPRSAGVIDQMRDQQAFHPDTTAIDKSSVDFSRNSPTKVDNPRGNFNAERSNPANGGRHQ